MVSMMQGSYSILRVSSIMTIHKKEKGISGWVELAENCDFFRNVWISLGLVSDVYNWMGYPAVPGSLDNSVAQPSWTVECRPRLLKVETMQVVERLVFSPSYPKS